MTRTSPLSGWLDMMDARDPAPARLEHMVCTLSLAWARAQGVSDADMHSLGEDFKSSINFFEWDRRPIEIVGARPVHLDRNAGPLTTQRIDAAWDGDHLALRVEVARGRHLREGGLALPAGLPETIVNALPGMRLSDVVELPFDVDAVVARVTRETGSIHVEVEPRWTTVRAS
jgi:hypothetical protein